MRSIEDDAPYGLKNFCAAMDVGHPRGASLRVRWANAWQTCLPLMREVDFAVGKRRRERRKALSALAGSGTSPKGRG